MQREYEQAIGADTDRIYFPGTFALSVPRWLAGAESPSEVSELISGNTAETIYSSRKLSHAESITRTSE